MPRVFLCHASADRLFLTREIIPLLHRHGVETWFSEDDIRTAEEWEQSIRKGLSACDWFLVALSPRALISPWVRSEVHWAAERRDGHIVPILLEACDPTSLHLRLTQLQYVDFTTITERARRRLLATWNITYEPSPESHRKLPFNPRDRVAQLPGYTLIKTLGRGASATVFLMQSEQLMRQVAVKVVGQDLGSEFIGPFLQKIRQVGRVHHRAVISVFSVTELDDSVVVVMEYIAGPTLAEALKRGLSVREAVKVVAGVSEGLHAAHLSGLLHLDVKPQNILLDPQGNPHLGDFSFSPAYQGYVLGTLSYLSPEQMTGGEADARSDIWSLGIILYELLSGRRPFVGTSLESMKQALRCEPTSLRDLDPSIPIELEQICRACLSKAPDSRYSTAAELAHSLREWLAATN